MATTLVSIVTSTGSTVLDRKAQQSDGLPCEQTLGDGGKEKIPFNCKKHLEKPGQEGAATCLNQLGWGELRLKLLGEPQRAVTFAT